MGSVHKEATHGFVGGCSGPATVVVAVDPGKVMNRVWVSNGAGHLEEPVSLPFARSGIAVLEEMFAAHADCFPQRSVVPGTVRAIPEACGSSRVCRGLGSGGRESRVGRRAVAGSLRGDAQPCGFRVRWRLVEESSPTTASLMSSCLGSGTPSPSRTAISRSTAFGPGARAAATRSRNESTWGFRGFWHRMGEFTIVTAEEAEDEPRARGASGRAGHPVGRRRRSRGAAAQRRQHSTPAIEGGDTGRLAQLRVPVSGYRSLGGGLVADGREPPVPRGRAADLLVPADPEGPGDEPLELGDPQIATLAVRWVFSPRIGPSSAGPTTVVRVGGGGRPFGLRSVGGLVQIADRLVARCGCLQARSVGIKRAAMPRPARDR